MWFVILLLCAVLTTAALAEGAWLTLWNSGCDLLFRTENVTVDGEAFFSLDGEHFKTARLHYVQDGYSSFYGWTLFTPRADGSERETGWTVIADEEGRYRVMEAYYPGTYRIGSDNRQNTLLRRSVQLDALTDLAGLILAQLDPVLPADMIAVSEKDGEQNIHIALDAGQMPDLAAGVLNLGAGYLMDRWFGVGHDRTFAPDEGLDFESYVTVTQALTYGTVRWNLRNADVDFTLDDQGRLTAARGGICMESTFWDGSVRQIDVQFNAAMTDWGVSQVKPFDPDDYGVTLQREYLR